MPKGDKYQVRRQALDIAAQYGLTQFTIYVFFAGIVTWLSMVGAIEFAIYPIDYAAIDQEASTKHPNQLEQIQKYVEQTRFAQELARYALLGAVFLLLPLGTSYAFTVYHPEKRIIPPLFMHLVAIPFLIVYAYFRFISINSQLAGLLAVAVMFMIVIGFYQDKLMVRLLGRVVNPKDMETRVLRATGGTVKDIQKILMEKGTKNVLDLSKNVTHSEDGRLILKTRNIISPVNYIELVEDKINKAVWINLVFFEKGQYFTKRSDELEAQAEETTAFIIRILKAPADIFVEELEDEYPKDLIERATADLRGITSQAEKWTTFDKVRTVLYGLSFAPPIGYYLQNGWDGNIYGLIATSIGIFAALVGIDATVRIAHQRKVNNQ